MEDVCERRIDDLDGGQRLLVEVSTRLVEELAGQGHVGVVDELLVVAGVCVVFLWHLRSAFVAVVSLPLGMLVGFGIMHWQGINANIMSLGGIAIAIGALVQVAPPIAAGAGERPVSWIVGLAVVSIALVAINMFGGFAVTRRMLDMFRK